MIVGGVVSIVGIDIVNSIMLDEPVLSARSVAKTIMVWDPSVKSDNNISVEMVKLFCPSKLYPIQLVSSFMVKSTLTLVVE